MLRIIAGSARGTRLTAPEGRGTTRPTLGRVRESIFNVLANLGIIDSRVLDIFAGTGAMGLEALSRGAEKAWFLDRATTRIIRENAKKCHVEDKAVIMGGDVMRSLASLSGTAFDYIFMDPPYAKGYINKIIKALFEYHLVVEGTVLIVEHTVKEPLNMEEIEPFCALWKEKKTGEKLVTYLTVKAENQEKP